MKPLLIALLTTAAALPLAGAIADFEDLTVPAAGYYNGSDAAGGFTSAGIHFNTHYDTTYGSWDGFAYANLTSDPVAGGTVTEVGWSDQYKVAPGAAASGSVYALGYLGYTMPPTITLPDGVDTPASLKITNDLYTWGSMTFGDAFAKQFGAGDWYRVRITGHDAQGGDTGSVDAYLADFRDGSQAGIVDDWQTVDLAPLGTGVKTITFDLASSDNSQFGMNTPGYFALDDLEVLNHQAWMGFAYNAGDWADTGNFLGWVWISPSDVRWVWSDALQTWVYVPGAPDGNVSTQGGGWVYVLR